MYILRQQKRVINIAPAIKYILMSLGLEYAHLALRFYSARTIDRRVTVVGPKTTAY